MTFQIKPERRIIPLSPQSQMTDDLGWVSHFPLVMREECEKPIGGGINGVAIGAGFSLAMAPAIGIASSSARFFAHCELLTGASLIAARQSKRMVGKALELPSLRGHQSIKSGPPAAAARPKTARKPCAPSWRNAGRSSLDVDAGFHSASTNCATNRQPRQPKLPRSRWP